MNCVRPTLVAGIALMVLMWLGSPAVRAEAQNLEIDPVHSMVVFRIGHLNNVGHILGRFNEPRGTVVVDEANPANSRLELKIDPAKVDTANQQRDDHLRGPDFFNVKQFPEITFTSTSVEKSGDAGGDDDTYEVSGDLTLHGVTKPITVTVRKVGSGAGMQGEQRTGFSAEVDLKRSDYGMTGLPQAVGDDVHLYIVFEGIHQQQQ